MLLLDNFTAQKINRFWLKLSYACLSVLPLWNNYNNYILYYTILVIKNNFLYWKKSDIKNIKWKTLTLALFNFPGKQFYRNTLTTDFARAFMNDHTGYYGRSYTSQVLCNKIGPLVSQDLPTHRPKSHDFFNAHLPLFTWTILTKSKTIHWEWRDFESTFGISIPRFWCDT